MTLDYDGQPADPRDFAPSLMVIPVGGLLKLVERSILDLIGATAKVTSVHLAGDNDHLLVRWALPSVFTGYTDSLWVSEWSLTTGLLVRNEVVRTSQRIDEIPLESGSWSSDWANANAD